MTNKLHPLQYVTFSKKKNGGHIAVKIDLAFSLVSVSAGTQARPP